MAVKITVLDKDAQMAADIANTIAELVDSTKNQMQKERARMGYEIVKAEYEKLQADVKEIVDSLRVIGEHGVHDYESQSEMINQQLAIEIANGRTRAIAALEKRLETLAKYGGAYVSIRDALEYDKKNFAELKVAYKKAKVDAEAYIPQKFIVDQAYKAEKKSYPVRWLIVAVSLFSSFILVILFLIFLENVKKIRQNSVKNS